MCGEKKRERIGRVVIAQQDSGVNGRGKNASCERGHKDANVTIAQDGSASFSFFFFFNIGVFLDRTYLKVCAS